MCSLLSNYASVSFLFGCKLSILNIVDCNSDVTLDPIFFHKQADFGLWTPDQKQVTKEKVSSRILCAAWSADGSQLALGMLSGLISVRNQQAEEVLRFERKAPIWCLAFMPDFAPPPPKPAAGGPGVAATAENSDILAVGCWDKTYSLYR